MKTVGAIFEQTPMEVSEVPVQEVPPPQPVPAESGTVDYSSLPVQSLRKILRQERGMEDASSFSREECLAMLTGENDHNESA
jgi:hypothetical protein